MQNDSRSRSQMLGAYLLKTEHKASIYRETTYVFIQQEKKPNTY